MTTIVSPSHSLEWLDRLTPHSVSSKKSGLTANTPLQGFPNGAVWRRCEQTVAEPRVAKETVVEDDLQ